MKVGIIGGGPSGIMAAYTLSENKDVKVKIFEQGKDIEDRKCPIMLGKVDKCINCESCSIMSGMAGAGAFSDGKYNVTTEFGGWLQDIIEPNKVIEYIEKADEILVNFGATTDRFMPNDELKKRCIQNNLSMLQSQCKHLGTDANYQTMKNIIDALKSRPNVEILTNAKVTDIIRQDDGLITVDYEIKGVPVQESVLMEDVDVLIFAVGRVGSGFFADWCEKHHVVMHNNQVDIGVRVELPSIVWEEFEKKIYEPKIVYTTEKYGDVCRTFCFNGRGEVVLENSNGILTVNGHAYKDESKKTKNTNFALLSTTKFTNPFNKPIEYAKYIAKLSNMISGGSVIVQRLGDLEKGRRTNENRLKASSVKPTLKVAVPGDLSLCLPKRQLDNIIETLHALDKIAPGTANPDTLLYGIECKYYSARPETDENFQIILRDLTENNDCSNLYAIGDGAGFTRSLGQASAQGILVGENILRRFKNEAF